MDTATANRFSPRSWVLLGVLFAASGYVGLIALIHLATSVIGVDGAALEPHLLVLSLMGLMVLEMWVVLAVVALGFALHGAWRWHQQGFVAATFSLSVALAVAILVEGVFYGHAAIKQRQKNHAKALKEAVARADRKHVREVVFSCKLFCGYEADIGPLVWLVSQAESEADINAIGKMLERKHVPRHVRSAWLADRRTPLEAAVDRYAAQPQLAPYLLGLTSHQHFQVYRAAQDDVDATLLYAMKTRAPLQLVIELVRGGANPKAVIAGETAYVTAQNLDRYDALDIFDRAARGSLP